MTAEPRTEAGRVVVMQLVADGVVTREAAETWVAAIEAEAAQQGVDGAALSLGLTIDGSKMSKAYIEKALARVEETWRAALPVPALDALNALAAKVRTEREAIAVCPHCDETDERNTARIIVLDWVLQQVAAPDALREALEAIVEMSWDPDPPRRLTALNRINVTARAALREGETP